MKAINKKCENCGAPLIYISNKQIWECNFCGAAFIDIASNKKKSKLKHMQENADFKEEKSTRSVEAPDFGEDFVPTHAAPTFEPEPNAVIRETLDKSDYLAYRCSDCGARTIANISTDSKFCVFCHSSNIISEDIEGDYKPDYILPFAITKEKVVKKIREECASKKLLPKRYKKYLDKGEVSGVYLPFCLYSGSAYAEIKVSNRIKGESWQKGDQEHTKINTFEHVVSGKLDHKSSPYLASEKVNRRLMSSIMPYSIDKLEDFRQIYANGFNIESTYSEQKDLKKDFIEQAGSATQYYLRQEIPELNRLRVLDSNVNIRQFTDRYILLPVWILSVPYDKKTYCYMINGETGKSAKEFPTSRYVAAWRFFMAFGISALTMALIVFLFIWR